MNKTLTIGVMGALALLGGAVATAANIASAQTASNVGTTTAGSSAWHGKHMGSRTLGQ